eukprot:jgi/Ulvmu1/5134/UM021_0151.1
MSSVSCHPRLWTDSHVQYDVVHCIVTGTLGERTMGTQIQVISASGVYEPHNVDAFLERNDLSGAGVSYTTVAIMGPQSSGKSTLLNAVFGTDFKMMDAETGRSQTTQGVWLDLSPKLLDVPTLVMDLEGSDGRERGEDDTNFERQSALFALAISDILMINLFAVNIGRVQGSGAPLLKTCLQVNLKLFQAAPGKNKTILLIVIRDRTRTPHAKMAADMRADLDSIWSSLVKPPEYTEAPLDDFFELQYVSLPSFELEEEEFRAECTLLRRQFTHAYEDSLLRPDESKVPASALGLHLQEVWSVISAQKDLDLPAHKVMVAHIRCKDISAEQLASVQQDNAWVSLMDEACAGETLMSDFGKRAGALIESCLYGYETEAMYFVESVRVEQKHELRRGLASALRPAFIAQREILHAQLLREFECALDVGPHTGKSFVEVAMSMSRTLISKYYDELKANFLPEGTDYGTGAEDFAAALHVAEAAARTKVLRACEAQAMEEVEAAVDGPAWMLISQFPSDLWLQLRALMKQALKQSVASVDQAVHGYGVPDEQVTDLHLRIASAMSSKLIKSLQKFLLQINQHLLAKFTRHFEEDHGVRRAWNSDLQKDAETARNECAKSLMQVAVVPQGLHVPGVTDDVFKRAKECIFEFAQYSSSASAPDNETEQGVPSLLTMLKWDSDVPPEAVLLSPADIRHSWQDFMTASQTVLRRAKELQDERRRSTQRPLPLWVLPALIFFGWNEVMGLLKSPFWLLACVFLLLFLYQLYNDLEVDKEMEKGLPASAIAIGHKLVPSSKRIFVNTFKASKKLFDAAVTDDSVRDDPRGRPQRGTAGHAAEGEMLHVHDSPVQGLHHRKAGESSECS